MSPPAQPADRREPMPGLFALPGHLLRQLSPGWRRAVIAIAAVMLAALVATAIVLAPKIAESNRERAAEQRREERRAAAERLERLRAEQRPRTGRTTDGVPGVEAAITLDARARAQTGEFNNPAIRTDCRTLTRHEGRLLLGCTAVTTDFEGSEDVRGVLIGYPYRAALSPADGRYGICKTSGRPGEGALERREQVGLPAACGG
jgi:hypothetical protein